MMDESDWRDMRAGWQAEQVEARRSQGCIPDIGRDPEDPDSWVDADSFDRCGHFLPSADGMHWDEDHWERCGG